MAGLLTHPTFECLPAPHVRDSDKGFSKAFKGLQLREQSPIFTGFPFHPGGSERTGGNHCDAKIENYYNQIPFLLEGLRAAY